MTNFTCFMLLVILFFSCKEDNTQATEDARERTDEKSVRGDTLDEKVYTLIKKALTTGDTIAYSYASSAYFHEGNEEEFLYTALIMANKYHYSGAYYQVYTTLAYSYTGETLETLDHDTRCLALYYLLRASEKGDDRAKDECETIFKEKQIPPSSFFLLEMAKD